jgi:probable HAF family extracellular repeat protein
MRRSAIAFVLLLVAAFGARAVGPEWKLVDLGNLGGDFAIASAVTDDGTVAGYSIAPEPNPAPGQPTGLSHGFLWRNGTMVDLGMLPNTLGVAIVDMNASSMLVGTTDGTSISGGIFWRDGAWGYLAPMAFPRAVNNSGVIVGQHGYGTHTEAFVYTGSALLGLGTFGGVNSYALGVNDRGQVVGGSEDSKGQSHAFLWQDGIMTDLGTFDGDHTGAVDIDNNGLVLVATQSRSTGRWTPYIWDGSVARKLFAQPYGMDFYARAMNDRGDVIGQVGLDNTLAGGVVLDGELTILDAIPEVVAAGLHDMNPSRINNRRWIVGASKDAQGSYHAFLLIRRQLK